jgi:hypothetical protein
MRSMNLLVKFLLKIGAIAAFAYWGIYAGSGASAVIWGLLAPALAVAVWGTFAAPRSSRRLPTRARIPLEMTVFGLAVVALIVAGSLSVAVAFAAVVVVNAILLTFFRQWEL